MGGTSTCSTNAMGPTRSLPDTHSPSGSPLCRRDSATRDERESERGYLRIRADGFPVDLVDLFVERQRVVDEADAE